MTIRKTPREDYDVLLTGRTWNQVVAELKKYVQNLAFDPRKKNKDKSWIQVDCINKGAADIGIGEPVVISDHNYTPTDDENKYKFDSLFRALHPTSSDTESSLCGTNVKMYGITLDGLIAGNNRVAPVAISGIVSAWVKGKKSRKPLQYAKVNGEGRLELTTEKTQFYVLDRPGGGLGYELAKVFILPPDTAAEECDPCTDPDSRMFLSWCCSSGRMNRSKDENDCFQWDAIIDLCGTCQNGDAEMQAAISVRCDAAMFRVTVTTFCNGIATGDVQTVYTPKWGCDDFACRLITLSLDGYESDFDGSSFFNFLLCSYDADNPCNSEQPWYLVDFCEDIESCDEECIQIPYVGNCKWYLEKTLSQDCCECTLDNGEIEPPKLTVEIVCDAGCISMDVKLWCPVSTGDYPEYRLAQQASYSTCDAITECVTFDWGQQADQADGAADGMEAAYLVESTSNAGVTCQNSTFKICPFSPCGTGKCEVKKLILQGDIKPGQTDYVSAIDPCRTDGVLVKVNDPCCLANACAGDCIIGHTEDGCLFEVAAEFRIKAVQFEAVSAIPPNGCGSAKDLKKGTTIQVCNPCDEPIPAGQKFSASIENCGDECKWEADASICCCLEKECCCEDPDECNYNVLYTCINNDTQQVPSYYSPIGQCCPACPDGTVSVSATSAGVEAGKRTWDVEVRWECDELDIIETQVTLDCFEVDCVVRDFSFVNCAPLSIVFANDPNFSLGQCPCDFCSPAPCVDDCKVNCVGVKGEGQERWRTLYCNYDISSGFGGVVWEARLENAQVGTVPLSFSCPDGVAALVSVSNVDGFNVDRFWSNRLYQPGERIRATFLAEPPVDPATPGVDPLCACGPGGWTVSLSGNSIATPACTWTSEICDDTLPEEQPNQAPTAISPLTYTINEDTDTTGGYTLTTTLVTTDPDEGDTHVYSVVGGADASNFTVSGTELTFDAAVVLASTTYTCVLRSTDQGGLYVDQTVTVTITDTNQAPTGASPSNRYYPDGTNTTGGVQWGIGVVDPDVGDTHTATIQGGADSAKFSIVNATTPIVVDFDDGTLDYATKSSYVCIFRLTDGGGLFYDHTTTVNVLPPTNNAPTDISPSEFSIDEGTDTSGGYFLGTLVTTDPDVGDTHTLSIVGGSDAIKFTLIGDTLWFDDGIVDPDVKSIYGVTVRTTDQDDATFDKGMTVSITPVAVDPCQNGCEVDPPDLENVNANWERTLSEYDPITGDFRVVYKARVAVSDQPSGSLVSAGTASATLTNVVNVLSWSAGSFTGKTSYALGETISFEGTSTPPEDVGLGCGLWGFNLTGNASTGVPFAFTAFACVE